MLTAEKGDRMKKHRFFLSIVLLAALLAIGCVSGDESGAGTSGRGTLRVGVRDDIPNFGYRSEKTGKYYGFEIDLANALAAKLGYAETAFQAVTPDNRKQTLLDGEVDCLIACYSIEDSRLKNFDFSPAYYADAVRVMVENSTGFRSLSDLQDKTVGVLAGANTTYLLCGKMKELGLLPGYDENNFNPVTFDDGLRFYRAEQYSELDTALETGDVDAVCMDGSIASGYLSDDRHFLDETIDEFQYGVATQKDSELSGRMAEAVQALLDDGTVAALIDKWD